MTSTRRKRGEYAKTPKTREAILASAFEVFSRGGYVNSSMSEIARGAGLTVPGMTNHFPTKAGLLEAVLQERDANAAALLADRTGVGLLSGLLDIVARDEADANITQLFAIVSAEATMSDHPTHDYFVARYELVLANIERGLREAADAGHLRDGVDPAGAAQCVVALFGGLQLQRLYAVGKHTESTLIRGYLQSLLTVPLG